MIITAKELADKLQPKKNKDEFVPYCEIISEGDKHYIVFKTFGQAYRAAIHSPLTITYET